MKDSVRLLEIFNRVLRNNNLKTIHKINPNTNLQKDLEMDSIILAELTVRIEQNQWNG